MSRRLTRTVVVRTADGSAVAFGPNDDVPVWAAEQITNPDVWASEPQPVDDAGELILPPSEPPSGNESAPPPTDPPAKSALKDEWVDYAVAQGMTRDEAETWTKEQLIATYGREA